MSPSAGDGWLQIGLRVVVFPWGIYWLAQRAGASKFIAILTSVIGSIVVFAIIGAAAGSGGSDKSSAPAPSADVTPAPASQPEYTGVVRGTFASKASCLACGDMVQYVSASNAWCGWKDGKVVIHATFRNDSVEHVTIHWHPSYTIVGGGAHGEGLGSIQDSGLDANSTVQAFATQEPKGVAADSAIGECKPSYSLVESG